MILIHLFIYHIFFLQKGATLKAVGNYGNEVWAIAPATRLRSEGLTGNQLHSRQSSVATPDPDSRGAACWRGVNALLNRTIPPWNEREKEGCKGEIISNQNIKT